MLIFDYISGPIRSVLPNEAFINGVFFTMIVFILLCHRFPQWVARKQSNPYTMQVSWNFGQESFNFQLLNYEIYHVSAFCRWSHHLTILFEAFMWIVLIRSQFGEIITAGILTVLVVQAFSYGDFKFGIMLASLQTCFVLMAEWLVTSNGEELTVLSKEMIFWSVLIRTLSHVLEVIPPLVNGDSDKFSKENGLVFAFTNPKASIIAFILGDLSEMGSGLPGRLFPVVFYLVACHFGLRSEEIESLSSTGKISNRILNQGWSSYHLTSALYSWARKAPLPVPKLVVQPPA